MKLTPFLLLTASVAIAQTTKPPVHHTTTAAHRTSTTTGTSACGGDAIPSLPATIPKITATCSKSLYALRYVDTVVGTGSPVSARKWLTVNYTGYLPDGTKFDSSIGAGPDGKPKEPITFPYGAHQVIAGWDTGFEGMNIGGKRRLFIPYELAYGEAGRPPVIPAKSPLIFDVELVNLSDSPPPPKAPPTPPTPPPTPPTAAPPATPDAAPKATPNPAPATPPTSPKL